MFIIGTEVQVVQLTKEAFVGLSDGVLRLHIDTYGYKPNHAPLGYVGKAPNGTFYQHFMFGDSGFHQLTINGKVDLVLCEKRVEVRPPKNTRDEDDDSSAFFVL